jgi:Cu/Ag efflux protein CusF
MKRAIAIVVSFLFVLSVAGLSFAAEKAATTAPAATEKKAPAKIKQVTGEITAVDMKANTLTVKGKKGDVTVTCDDKTSIMIGKDKKALADLKTGDNVKVKYTEADGKMTAKSVTLKTDKMDIRTKKKKAETAVEPVEKK